MSKQTFAIIDMDGSNYLIDAEDYDHAMVLLAARAEGATDVADALGLEMPRDIQMEEGSAADWIEERARASGRFSVIRGVAVAARGE